MTKSKILIVEDTRETRELLLSFLEKEFETVCALNGVEGLEVARTQAPDLILMDIMLPILNGYDVCNLLKKNDRTRHIPIIFLSEKKPSQNISKGFENEDDYIPKPFDLTEIMARIHVRLRKSKDETPQTLVVGNLTIDPSQREVSFEGKKTKLTLTEFDLLKFLASKAGAIVTRDSIMQGVWKDDVPKSNDRTIDVHIRALRKKIPLLNRHILSIYGIGYKYEP